jgi:hypothetical protein
MNIYKAIVAGAIVIVATGALIVSGCNKSEDPPPARHEPAHFETPPPVPPPVATNPFEKAPPAPPAPIHEQVHESHWEQVGGETKLNDTWSLFTWRDSANHNTCYFYNVFNDNDHHAVIGHGMSCVKE